MIICNDDTCRLPGLFSHDHLAATIAPPVGQGEGVWQNSLQVDAAASSAEVSRSAGIAAGDLCTVLCIRRGCLHTPHHTIILHFTAPYHRAMAPSWAIAAWVAQ